MTGWSRALLRRFGRRLLVTENDYGLGPYNGDTGGVVAHGHAGGVRAVFERQGRLVELTPQRLASVDTVYVMTVHEARGSSSTRSAVLSLTRRRPF